MPFDKFLDIQTIMEARREAIQQSLRSVSIDELRKLAKEHEDEFVDDPWRDKMLRLIEERPQASFYHAVPQENVVVVYCRDEDFGLWILPGSGMGPLPEEAKRHMKEAIAMPFAGRKQVRH
jgi:rhodanese-related sulfurtransferase